MRSGEAGRKAGRAQRGASVKPKPRNPPKSARCRHSVAADSDTNVAILKRERDEALEQQRATSEVLRAISDVPTDASSILAAIAQSVARLLEVTDAEINMLIDGNLLRSVAKVGRSPNWPLGTTRVCTEHLNPGVAVMESA